MSQTLLPSNDNFCRTGFQARPSQCHWKIQRFRTSEDTTTKRKAITTLVLIFALCVLLPRPSVAQETEAWEYSPYRVHVWLATQPTPQLTSRLEQQIRQYILWQAEIVEGSAWRVDVESAPQPWHDELLAGFQFVSLPENVEDTHPLLRGDKLILLRIVEQAGEFLIQARELDCRSRIFGPPVTLATQQIAAIPSAAFTAVASAFMPLARIEKVNDREKTAQVRVRAAGLVLSPNSPAAMGTGEILRPVVRQNDRLGKLRAGGIQVVPWTFLRATDQRGPNLGCMVYSGLRSPLGGRGSRRVEKFALAVRPTATTTILQLNSSGAAPHPLSGYEVYSRRVDTENSELLGRTDWRGQLLVDRGDQPLRILYVKSGTRLLARLPMVPGLEPLQTAPMFDDDIRLGAEGSISSLQNNFLDLVARRQVLATRIRLSIEERDFAEAERLIEELRGLATRIEFTQFLNEETRNLASDNQREQQNIDELINDIRRLLVNQLDPQLVNDLDKELRAARTGGGGFGS